MLKVASMKIKDAALILASMAEKYPDCNLSVHCNGAHHTRELLFYAITPIDPVVRSLYPTYEKADKEAMKNDAAMTKAIAHAAAELRQELAGPKKPKWGSRSIYDEPHPGDESPF